MKGGDKFTSLEALKKCEKNEYCDLNHYCIVEVMFFEHFEKSCVRRPMGEALFEFHEVKFTN